MESSQDIMNGTPGETPPIPPNPIQQPQILNDPSQPTVYPQQQQYAAYIQQQRYAMMQQQQQQYLAQQRYMAQYIAQQKQLQQQQYTQYYQQIYQQYGHAAMVQAMQQNNYMNTAAHASPRSSGGQIILSSEEQPLIMSSSKPKRKGRKRKKPESPNKAEEEIMIELNEHGFDEYTLINKDEELPDHNTEFDEWLHFTKQLWQRQRKYKKGIMSKEEKEILELEESLSCGDMTLSPTSSGTLPFRSSFLKDRIRRMKGNVLKNKTVVNIMIKMGLAPPWNEMPKYKKWKRCHQLNK